MCTGVLSSTVVTGVVLQTALHRPGTASVRELHVVGFPHLSSIVVGTLTTYLDPYLIALCMTRTHPLRLTLSVDRRLLKWYVGCIADVSVALTRLY